METEDLNPLIQPADTAKMLGISLVTLTDWLNVDCLVISRGGGLFYEIGNIRLFKK